MWGSQEYDHEANATNQSRYTLKVSMTKHESSDFRKQTCMMLSFRCAGNIRPHTMIKAICLPAKVVHAPFSMSTQPMPVSRGTAVQPFPADVELPLQDFTDDMLQAIDAFAGSQGAAGDVQGAFDQFDTHMSGLEPLHGGAAAGPSVQAVRRAHAPAVHRHERNRTAQRRSRERSRVIHYSRSDCMQ